MKIRSLVSKIVDFYKVVYTNFVKDIDQWRNEVYYNKYHGKKHFDDAYNNHPKQSMGFIANWQKRLSSGKLFLSAANCMDYCTCRSCTIITAEATETQKGWKRLGIVCFFFPCVVLLTLAILVAKLT